ncbi:MAG TPA: AMP-binding protein, partial [Aggregatilineales bacterium]|nr:AMP-binding protein [Aggregatilineales bacterium]
RVAVVEPDGRGEDGKRRYRRSTYEELSHDAESIAVGLREVGIAERTRTVFMAPPSYEACAVYLALTRVGALPSRRRGESLSHEDLIQSIRATIH